VPNERCFDSALAAEVPSPQPQRLKLVFHDSCGMA
jgi:hypothetical protein